MNPHENLREQRSLANSILTGEGLDPDDRDEIDSAAECLAELVLELDRHRREGGADPYGEAPST
jgi:hypothetical protein